MKNIHHFLTPKEAAKFLNVSLSTLKKFIYSGKIKTLKTPGGHHRIRKGDLFALVQVNSNIPSPTFNPSKNLLEVTESLLDDLEKRQEFRKGHTHLVAQICLNIAKNLNIPYTRRSRLHVAALLHDVGMLGISKAIFNKETPLDDNEYSILKTHPIIGEDIVNSIKRFSGLAKIVRQHHERYDGAGYPDGLKENEISLEARIIAVAESYSSMIAKDSYRRTLSEEEAIGEIEVGSWQQFDPQVVDAFLREYKRV